MKNKARQFLSAEQIQAFKKPSLAKGLAVVAYTWLVIAASFAVAVLWPNPLTFAAVVVVLGSRMLSLAIIMHEGSHRTLAPQAWLNNFLGQWFGAAPIVQDMYRYRIHHMRHHTRTGHADDPDLRLAEGYPVTRASLRRKFFRDAVGLTGVKALIGSLMMVAGVWEYNVSGEKPVAHAPERSLGRKLADALAGIAPTVITNGLMFLLLGWLASASFYLLWVVAYLCVYPWVLRVRSIAEHAMTTDPDDALNNARTTYGRWWERQLFAPLNVNYHLEHHMLPTVPFYNLPRMHRALKAAGAFEQAAAVEQDYRAVLKQAASG